MKNKGRLFIAGVVAIVFLVINSFGSIIKFATDYLWFKEVGYTQTFLTKIKAQFMIGIPIFVLLSIVLYIFIKRLKKKYDEESEIVTVNKKSGFYIRLISAGISLLITVNIVSSMWFEILQYLNGGNFGITDPIFNNDISFYVFKLPLINTAVNSIISILFMLVVVIVLFYAYLAIKDSVKNISEQFENIQQFPRQQIDLSSVLNKKFAEKIINKLSILGIFIFIFLGIRYALKSYDLLYSQLGRVFGASYTDINITLNLYRILAVGCGIAAVTFFIGSRKKT